MDTVDQAQANEELHRKIAVNKARSCTPPNTDVQGNVLCVDCEAIIPPERVRIVRAIRCLECQQAHEATQALYGGSE